MGRKKLELRKICENCNKVFDMRQPDGSLNQKLRFCSRSCATKKAALTRKIPVRTAEWKRKIGEAQKGFMGNNWKGGKWSSQTQSERKSAKYRNLRREILERDNYTCQICNLRGGDLNVDHIKPYSKFPELRFSEENLRTLCVPCHKKTDTYARN